MPKDINLMKQARAEKVKELRGILDAAEARSNKKFTSDEEKRYADLEKDIDQRDEEIRREEALQKRELGTAGRTAEPLSEEIISRENPLYSRSFNRMFPNRRGSDFADTEHRELFWRNVVSGRLPEESRAGSSTLSGPSGGFAVPDVISSILWDGALQASIMRSRSRLVPQESQSLKIPAFDTQDQSSSVAGFVGEWLSEGGTATDQSGQMRYLESVLKKCAIYTSYTREMGLFAGSAFVTALENAISQALAFYLDKELIAGNGVGKPLGFLNSPCAIDVPRTIGGSIVYADLCAMYARKFVAPQKPFWLVNPTAMSELLTLKDEADQLIWQANTPLLGLEVVECDKCPALGTTADISLVNPGAGYVVGQYPSLFIDSTNAAEWSTDKISLRIVALIDGNSVFSKPITPLSGDTVSPVVRLAA